MSYTPNSHTSFGWVVTPQQCDKRSTERDPQQYCGMSSNSLVNYAVSSAQHTLHLYIGDTRVESQYQFLSFLSVLRACKTLKQATAVVTDDVTASNITTFPYYITMYLINQLCWITLKHNFNTAS